MTLPKMCEGCGKKPQAYHNRRLCYDCKPGSKGRPRPCRKCGSTGNYWSEGLCSRCHQYAPQGPESCRDCDAWGVVRTTKWLCGGCMAWRWANPVVGVCVGCGRNRYLDRHRSCRLCRRQAKLLRQPGQPIDVAGANRQGQQLFFANMHSFKHRVRPSVLPPPPVLYGPRQPRSRAKQFHQLTLQPVPIITTARRYAPGDPPDPKMAGALDTLVSEHSSAHGWTIEKTRQARLSMRVLLAMRASADLPIRASDVVSLIAVGLPARPILDVLAGADMLDDDRSDPIKTWFDRRVQGLPEPMNGELRTWFEILRQGSRTSPRSRPRDAVTIRTRVNWSMPTLEAWAGHGHRSLREITRDDILDALPASGNPRATLGRALRSIFATLKGHKVIFVNPTARVDVGSFERRIPLPADPHDIQAALESADPSRAALAALVVFHGLRPVELRDLKLIDVRNGRLHLGGRSLPLAGPVKRRVTRYLTERHRRWPGTINPHFFVHQHTAGNTTPVSRIWVNKRLGMSAFALRQDRILDEVVATDGDERRICDFFGVTVATAEHYTSMLGHPGLGRDLPPTLVGSPTEGPT